MLKRFSRALCALTLILAMAATPTLAAQTQYETSGLSQVAAEAANTQAATLIRRGYSQEEVDVLSAKVSPIYLRALLYWPYSPAAAQCAAQPHFQQNRFARYLGYARANELLTPHQVVTYVNMGLDYSFYQLARQVQKPAELDVLVNKYNRLPADYVPQLTKMSTAYATSGAYMHPEAYAQFTKMADAARAEGLKLYSVSAYRTYIYQDRLYRGYVNRDGQAAADTYSARPGYSEHQTGLAVDINTASRRANFQNTPHYQWLSQHSWEYGFILRYPEGKQDLTGFTFEPWHYRYVGLELAKTLYESGLTLDEYMAGALTELPSVVQPEPEVLPEELPPEPPAPVVESDASTFLAIPGYNR